MKHWSRFVVALVALALIPASDVSASTAGGRAVVFKGTQINILQKATQVEPELILLWPAYEPFHIRHGFGCDADFGDGYVTCGEVDSATDFFLFDVVFANGTWRYRRVKTASAVWTDPDTQMQVAGAYRNFGQGQPPGIRTFCGLWVDSDKEFTDGTSTFGPYEFPSSLCIAMVFTDQSTSPSEASTAGISFVRR